MRRTVGFSQFLNLKLSSFFSLALGHTLSSLFELSPSSLFGVPSYLYRYRFLCTYIPGDVKKNRTPSSLLQKKNCLSRQWSHCGQLSTIVKIHNLLYKVNNISNQLEYIFSSKCLYFWYNGHGKMITMSRFSEAHFKDL